MFASVKRFMPAVVCGWLSVILLFGFATAQSSERTDVVLILDASGSMFNKLADGRYRITAAKEALTDFISRLPASDDLNVGLRVYGSSMLAIEDGACRDSHLRVPVAGLAREALLKTVQDTQARGATPIAYSLELAAQDLGSAPGRKLIVLVTDGEEACGGDVRAVYQSLLAAGLEFDLRIIGFDLDTRAMASFEGIGAFENATSAIELAEALGRAIVVEAPPAPAPISVSATLTRNGEPAVDGATLAFVTSAGDHYLFEHAGEGAYTASVPAGGYSAVIVDVARGELVFSGLAVVIDQTNEFAFEIEGSDVVTLTVADSAPVVGSSVDVQYQDAPADVSGWLTIVPSSAPEEVWLALIATAGESGTALVPVPREEGELEARYLVDLPEGGTRVIGRSAPFTATFVAASLSGPDTVTAGSDFTVSWQGPANVDDFVTVVPAGAPEHEFQAFWMTKQGDPASLLAPITPGAYELRYVTGDGAVLASAPLTVEAGAATVSAPASVIGGQRFELTWSGPGGDSDWVTITDVGSESHIAIDYRYVSDGNPVTLTAPLAPGVYELRYVAGEGSTTLATAKIEVLAVTVSLSAPDSVSAGEWFDVGWEGPGYGEDYITIVPVGAAASAYLSYSYLSSDAGNVVQLEAPGEPGAYELRYVNELYGYEVLAVRPITVR